MDRGRPGESRRLCDGFAHHRKLGMRRGPDRKGEVAFAGIFRFLKNRILHGSSDVAGCERAGRANGRARWFDFRQ